MNKWKILIGISILVLTLAGVANWGFPKGRAYKTGEYIFINDGNTPREIVNNLPSPQSNPEWVRVFQNSSGAIIAVSFIGMVVGFAKINH